MQSFHLFLFQGINYIPELYKDGIVALLREKDIMFLYVRIKCYKLDVGYLLI